MPIPWLKLITHAPTVLSLSRQVLQLSRQTPRDAEQEDAVRALTADLQRQAEVLHALAGQVEGLTAAMAALRRAMIWAISLGAVAAFLAAVALFLTLAG